MCSSHAGEALGSPPAIDMEQRNHMQLHVRIPDTECDDGRQSVQVKVPVGEHHSSGIRSGTAGIENLCRVVFVNRHGSEILRAGKKVFVGFPAAPAVVDGPVKRNEPLHAAQPGSHFFDDWVKIALVKERPRLGVVQDEGEFISRKPDVERKQHSPRLNGPVIRFQQAVAIAGQEGDAASLRHSHRLQSTGQMVTSVGKLRVGETQLAADDTGLSPIQLRRTPLESQWSQRNIHSASFETGIHNHPIYWNTKAIGTS